jgi:OmpA-OmpF porin, OOP family
MKKYLGLLAISIILQGCGALGKYPQGSGGYDERNKDGGTQNPNGGRQQTPTDDQYPTDRGSTSQGRPQSGRSADRHITVGDIRLTNQYTILYLSYFNYDKPGYYKDKQGREYYDDGSHDIAWSNTSELIAANGARTFRFVKAEGIPTIRPGDDLKRKGTKLPSGQTINFVVYFDRLDKGLENFDLFECQSDGYTCWNYYDLYVRNPADNIPAPTQTPPPPTSTEPPTKTRTKTGKVGEVDNTPPPAPVVTSINVGGVVRDVKTNRPVSATIDYQLSSSKQIIDSVQSFASTGLYRMTLPKGQVYTYIASAKGYLSANGVLDLSKTAGGQKVTKDIYLTPIAVGDKIVLKNIYFEVSKSDLLPASFAELNKLVSMMHDNPLMVIRLEGHTDVVGDPEANLELSQDRVDACEVYLVKQGIPSARIEAKGYGDTQPIVKKGTDEERKVNRRVEFVVLKL